MFLDLAKHILFFSSRNFVQVDFKANLIQLRDHRISWVGRNPTPDHATSKSYVWEQCPNAPWTLALGAEQPVPCPPLLIQLALRTLPDLHSLPMDALYLSVRWPLWLLGVLHVPPVITPLHSVTNSLNFPFRGRQRELRSCLIAWKIIQPTCGLSYSASTQNKSHPSQNSRITAHKHRQSAHLHAAGCEMPDRKQQQHHEYKQNLKITLGFPPSSKIISAAG